MTAVYSGNKYQKVYQKELEKLEKKLSVLLENKEPKSLYEPCSYVIRSGGKRLRPFLVLISAKAAGGKFSQAYNAAIAVELVHNFTLVHDDIMDNADLRRGRPTLHVKYDMSTAILAGDNLIVLAYQFLLKDSKINSNKVTSTFTQGIIDVCEGQSLDKDYEVKEEVSLDEYMIMIEKKTAALAAMCCSIGAQIGGGSAREIKALTDYGMNLGIAFQIQDDLLDIIGKEEFGKNVGGDLLEGKKTYLFLTALSKADGENKEDLIKVIKNKGIRKNQIKKYQKIYNDLGVIEDSRKAIEQYTNYALENLRYIKNKESKEMLEWLANSLIKRNK